MKYIATALLFLSGAYAQAATYYVSPSGSDAYDGLAPAFISGTHGPWQHIAFAACAGTYLCPNSSNNPNMLQAGDTLLLRGGTYNESNITFAHSGVAGSAITVRAYPGETPVIDGGFSSGTAYAPIFLLDGVNYIILDGLEIMRGDTMNILISYNSPAANITIQNCNIHDAVFNDNSGEIYVNSGSDQIFIRNNRLHGIQNLPATYNNGAGILLFDVKNTDIENNEIYNANRGIIYKHNDKTGYSTTVKNNLVHDLVESDGTGTAFYIIKDHSNFLNNIAYNVDIGVWIFDNNSACTDEITDHVTLDHNTFIVNRHGMEINDGEGCPDPPTGSYFTTIKNNMVTGTFLHDYYGIGIWRYPNPDTGVDGSNTTIEYNDVYSPAAALSVWVRNTGYAISSLPASNLGNVGTNIGQAPNFADPTAHNYALTSTSPGHNAASDGTDMGAQFCAVGVNASCSSITASVPPAAPRGLKL